MWSRILGIFRIGRTAGGPPEQSAQEKALEELRAVKKLLRKQELFLETFRQEVASQLYERDVLNAEPLLQIVDAFFHLDASIREMPMVSQGHVEALEMVWRKFEQYLGIKLFEVIRRAGVPFDPRLYEAVETVKGAGDASRPMVEKVAQPGFVHQGRVIRAARAIISSP
jgi:molecular chaperone GrpE (heat shock protein)